MSGYRKEAHRRTELRPLTFALASLGVLLATATVHSQNQTNTTQQVRPPVVRPVQLPVAPQQQRPAVNMAQPLAPAQRPAVNIPQAAPNTGNANQMRNLLNALGARNANGAAASQPQLQNRTSALTTTRPAAGTSAQGVSRGGAAALATSSLLGGHAAAPGIHETRLASGAVVRKAADGSVLEVANPRNGMLIQHGVDGSRRILVNQPDRSRIFASSRGVQYVQHPYTYGGRAYDHRTYYFQGRTVHRYYRPYTYGGSTLDAYAPTRFYPMTFYRWALTPFKPTPFQWNYTNEAWYRQYNSYFTPDASYSTPLSWLADFVIGSSLVTAYNAAQQSQQAAPPPDAASAITPQVKQMVAEETGRQVRQETLEAQQNASHVDPQPGTGGVVAELNDHQTHAFVVGSDLDLVDTSGRRCMVSEGDVVAVVSPVSADTSAADAVVLASKGGNECQRSVRVQIALNDVQEMQNHMREAIDEGLANTNAAKSVTSVTPAFAQAGPPADPNAAQEIEQQQQIAAAAGEG
jgi:hypothetical protein